MNIQITINIKFHYPMKGGNNKQQQVSLWSLLKNMASWAPTTAPRVRCIQRISVLTKSCQMLFYSSRSLVWSTRVNSVFGRWRSHLASSSQRSFVVKTEDRNLNYHHPTEHRNLNYHHLTEDRNIVT